jgi:HEAT repeat protein
MDLKELPTAELHRRVLEAPDLDDDDRWAAIAVLHNRGSQETFDLAAELCQSADPRRVSDGLDLLAQLGIPQRLHQEDARQLIREALKPELADDVLVSAASAVSHQDDSEAAPWLVELAHHPSAGVRASVAWALGSLQHPQVVPALIALTHDADADVRDWATFALARLREEDSDEIRAAFWGRVDDEDLDTRWEAVAGLVLRGIPEARRHLEEELRRAPEVENDFFPLVEAARFLKDPDLTPLLEALGEDSEWMQELADVVNYREPNE